MTDPITAQNRSEADETSVEALMLELESLPSTRERIEVVARDISSGSRRYADLNAYDLGELLGVQWEDAPADPWYRYFMASRADPEEDFPKLPFYEAWLQVRKQDNVQISISRVEEIEAECEEIDEGNRSDDLTLSDAEKHIVKEMYAEGVAEENGNDFIQCETVMLSEEGTKLVFKMCIGDGGEQYDFEGPYESNEGCELQGYMITEEGY